jgi:hypothetical protein
MGLIMGSQNIMGSDYGSNISEVIVIQRHGDFCLQRILIRLGSNEAVLNFLFI